MEFATLFFTSCNSEFLFRWTLLWATLIPHHPFPPSLASSDSTGIWGSTHSRLLLESFSVVSCNFFLNCVFQANLTYRLARFPCNVHPGSVQQCWTCSPFQACGFPKHPKVRVLQTSISFGDLRNISLLLVQSQWLCRHSVRTLLILPHWCYWAYHTAQMTMRVRFGYLMLDS